MYFRGLYSQQVDDNLKNVFNLWHNSFLVNFSCIRTLISHLEKLFVLAECPAGRVIHLSHFPTLPDHWLSSSSQAHRTRAARSCPLPGAKQLILELSCYVSTSSNHWPVPMRTWECCCRHCPVHNNEHRWGAAAVQWVSCMCASCTKETNRETSASRGLVLSWTVPEFDLIWWTW